MSEEVVVKPDYQVLLTKNYALDTDKLNLILKERYEKKDGKGKNANSTGEYGWRDLGYLRDITQVADFLVKHELMKEREVGELRDLQDAIVDMRDQIADHLNEYITISKK